MSFLNWCTISTFGGRRASRMCRSSASIASLMSAAAWAPMVGCSSDLHVVPELVHDQHLRRQARVADVPFQRVDRGNTILISPDHDLVIVWRWHAGNIADVGTRVVAAITPAAR